MSVERIRKGSTVNLIATVTEDGSALDISTASAKQITVIKPDGSTLAPSTSFVTDGTNGKVQATLTAANNDQTGTWRYYTSFTLSGLPYITEPTSFVVQPVPPATD